MSTPYSRRDFVKTSALAAAATLPLAQLLADAPAGAKNPSSDAKNAAGPAASPLLEGPGAPLHWFEKDVPAEPTGVTWGVPWKQGEHARNTAFLLKGKNGAGLPLQSWPLAYWPDGSLKWTAHAAVLSSAQGEFFRVEPAAAPASSDSAGIHVTETDEEIVIDTGLLQCHVARRGPVLVKSLWRDGREVARDGRLVGLRQTQAESSEGAMVEQRSFEGFTEAITLEQKGPVRAVVKLEGKHREAEGRAWLPFVVRLYFYAGSESMRMVHSFVFDGDEHHDFIRGLGVRFGVPMHDALQDRHLRFAGEGRGLWGEAVRPLTGLRRDPGEEARSAQVEGKPTPHASHLPGNVAEHLKYIPSWGDFTLAQLSADGFQIKKRTQPGYGWIPAAAGRRAGGLGYVGGISGGLVFGQRDFWQRHPTQLDIRGANTDLAEVTLWLWSPEAPPMDLRFYHDGLGMDDFAKQTEGLDITYEDYEPGFGSPLGTARSNELMFWAVAATPARERLADLARLVRLPPLLANHPAHLLSTGVFAGLWTPPQSGGIPGLIEARQDFLLTFYQRQVEQRRWYGFWDYGDVMHAYDVDRHVWRYDIGGFAWDNSELSTDLWLWLSYLRTGRADVFRLAEAMTRHTSEVDVHHLGPFKGLGSRHNVQHWGCSAKQVRVSNAAYRRFYYYMTGDERLGDLLSELVESHRAYLTLYPNRKDPHGARWVPPGPEGKQVMMSVGTDFGAIAAAWLTEWERTGEAKCRDRLVNTMKGIGALPEGFFSGHGLLEIETGALSAASAGENRISASHLSAVFGLVEICAELNQLLPVPEFDRAWLKYCELYNAPPEEFSRVMGQPPPKDRGLPQAHSRLTAYAAFRKKDAKLAERAWKEFLSSKGEVSLQDRLEVHRVEGPHVLSPVEEAAWVSTNSAAQWGLAAIEVLAWAGNHVPSVR